MQWEHSASSHHQGEYCHVLSPSQFISYHGSRNKHTVTVRLATKSKKVAMHLALAPYINDANSMSTGHSSSTATVPQTRGARRGRGGRVAASASRRCSGRIMGPVADLQRHVCGFLPHPVRCPLHVARPPGPPPRRAPAYTLPQRPRDCRSCCCLIGVFGGVSARSGKTLFSVCVIPTLDLRCGPCISGALTRALLRILYCKCISLLQYFRSQLSSVRPRVVFDCAHCTLSDIRSFSRSSDFQ